MIGAREHTLLLGPTGVDKSWLAVQLILGDIAADRGVLLIDPKGSTAKLVTVLAAFFGWFNSLNPAERSFILAAPMNKIRPLLQRASVRNVLAGPRATFTIGEALQESSS